MSHIEAIYRKGVFEPLQPVDFREDEHVYLHVESTVEASPLTWLDEVRSLQRSIVLRNGVLPDSSADIAADRAR